MPGYSQQTVPVPQAAQGQDMHEEEVKKLAQVPWAQTWLVVHAVPQLPCVALQWSGLLANSAVV